MAQPLFGCRKLHSLMPMRNSSITCSKPTSMQTTKTDLPFERPTKFYLKTNTRVTKSWGHRAAPSSLRARR
jgi:hypothetical protein